MSGDNILASISMVSFSYLIGAIPFGYLIVKFFYNTDIRTVGSKNPGATNVWRTFGKIPGITTLLLDCLKGLIPVLLTQRLFPDHFILWVVVGFGAIIGHNWSLFLLGRGGKGVATSAGVFFALTPVPMTLSFIGFVIFFFSTGYVSVGSIAAAMILLIGTLAYPTPIFLQGMVLVATLMVIVRHIPNMKRLRRGQEPKVKFRK